ncbi:4-hydroxy-tetrahydrodipicolinate synthase [Alkalihalobacillus trypoxylicola]|uniref:4-hydroxy-tetrahydrodipicolinate synthase n=1 Tax=Alkalihalobacillus trypoxylicola TaxID=519424 RepID=A0A161P5N2_9BACI|nr:4-hydroxy-tetrahydrodipicolinate synthase [Alkalihalobacillus trypoxylicola]KYG25533.1 4-hydroxy-tetrahydrodipicolinate synthase [Alkalihalobacillus trypoxylicola]
MNFGRVVTAMVTPFNEQNQIDENATKALIEHLIANGTDALVVGGTTGESPTLSTDEKIKLYQLVVDTVKHRIPVIAGTGTNSTHMSIELTKKAEQIGVDAIMLVTPYYNKPSQQGLYEHFKAIALETSLPVMLYNIPGRSSVNLSIETTIQLAQIPNIVATKEASGDLDAMAAIISQTPEDFYLYSGDDSLTLPILSIGGNGIVSVCSHILGKELQEMIAHFENGQVKEAATLHRHLLPTMKALFMAPNPAPVKSALTYYGVSTGSVRLPLLPLTEQEEAQLKNYLAPFLNYFVS